MHNKIRKRNRIPFCLFLSKFSPAVNLFSDQGVRYITNLPTISVRGHVIVDMLRYLLGPGNTEIF